MQVVKNDTKLIARKIKSRVLYSRGHFETFIIMIDLQTDKRLFQWPKVRIPIPYGPNEIRNIKDNTLVIFYIKNISRGCVVRR